MADNTRAGGFQDGQRINVDQKDEVAYLTKALGLSEEELREASQSVGVMADDVREWKARRH